jgi:hypothetical protein
MEPAIVRFVRGVFLGIVLGVTFLAMTGAVGFVLEIIKGALR